jgi:hypothetical protein
MSDTPTNAQPQRDDAGRFLPGHKGGPGNPMAAQVAAWRRALHETVTPDDIRAVMLALLEAAKSGKAWAVKEFFDRTLGKPLEADLIERMEDIERRITEALEEGGQQ